MQEYLIEALKYLVIFLLYVCFYYVIFPIIKIAFTFTIGRRVWSGRKDLIKYGRWAVVTGASEGIGKAYAHHLAKDGMNVVLISISLPDLQDVSHEIQEKYNVLTKILVTDFTKVDIYDEISKHLKDIEIGVLVNNVGISYPHPIYFDDRDVLSDKYLIGMVNCNCVSQVMMMRTVLPNMTRHGKGGLIINLSSLTECYPAPLLALYAASKAFAASLSVSVGMELGKRHNIDVQTVLPLFVATRMCKRPPSFSCPTPEDFVNSALDMVKVESYTHGCFSHALQALMFSLLPQCVLNPIQERIMKAGMMRELKKKNKSI